MRLGIDCGGTKTEACVFQNDKVIDHYFIPKSATQKTLFLMIKNIISKYNVSSIGIGFPAPINNGKVTRVNNIPEWNNTNIEKTIYDRFGIPCKVENDANCFALAEALEPENSTYKTIVGITLGTGLGVGIIRNKKILKGSTGAAGELCRIPYEKGILEDYIGKRFFKKEAVEVFRDAELGKKEAIKKVKEYSKHLGKMLSIITLTIEPRLIIFGGNISRSFHLFEADMKKELKRHIYSQTYDQLVIKTSGLTHAACRGAALL
ncbi:MAG: ROK family protein [Candidatus Woesearchaeota archaeon]